MGHVYKGRDIHSPAQLEKIVGRLMGVEIVVLTRGDILYRGNLQPSPRVEEIIVAIGHVKHHLPYSDVMKLFEPYTFKKKPKKG